MLWRRYTLCDGAQCNRPTNPSNSAKSEAVTCRGMDPRRGGNGGRSNGNHNLHCGLLLSTIGSDP
jgi:hypothetical protein